MDIEMLKPAASTEFKFEIDNVIYTHREIINIVRAWDKIQTEVDDYRGKERK